MNLSDPQIAAAALGAACAFLLMRLGEWLTAWHRRVDQNYSRLLRLEVVYRQYLIDVSGLRVRVADILQKRHPIRAVILGLPRLPEIDLPSSDIQSLDLLNALATHWTLVRKLNAEIASAANARALLETGIKSPGGLIDTDGLFKSYLATLSDVVPFISEIQTNTEKVIASILVLAQESRPVFTRLFDRQHPRWAGKSFDSKVAKELGVLRDELARCNAKRKADIQKTTGKEDGANQSMESTK